MINKRYLVYLAVIVILTAGFAGAYRLYKDSELEREKESMKRRVWESTYYKFSELDKPNSNAD